MKVHEYQGKEILEQYGVATQAGRVAASAEEAVQVATALQAEKGIDMFVVKAQIHAGGRGKGGGVKLARSVDEVRSIAGN
jgi:succinyl-CoA synthetase beta subunit